ncbi:carbohydrate-binding module family 13 protein [Sphaerobolus stellatus SS14]|uniref:Unplaced genomic scaffold SPHSTscaffold_260, whole genome shotgun sequence n=1 Tax=Sphaerobolus stellatus (strain SS14) TaxID=990650 RepID=A0A0C9TDZ6_SPHS4|nr:carbohydrate-binding module family 13 protein [Sphaerobolus stellatus SS14]
MPSVPDGIYRLTRGSDSDQAMTVMLGDVGANKVFLLPETVGQKNQEWKVINLSNGNVLIQQSASGQYLGYDGNLSGIMAFVVVGTEKTEWRIQPSDNEEGRFVVVVDKSPKEQKMVLDISLVRIYPPMIGVLPLGFNEEQAWDFEKV